MGEDNDIEKFKKKKAETKKAAIKPLAEPEYKEPRVLDISTGERIDPKNIQEYSEITEWSPEFEETLYTFAKFRAGIKRELELIPIEKRLKILNLHFVAMHQTDDQVIEHALHFAKPEDFAERPIFYIALLLQARMRNLDLNI